MIESIGVLVLEKAVEKVLEHTGEGALSRLRALTAAGRMSAEIERAKKELDEQLWSRLLRLEAAAFDAAAQRDQFAPLFTKLYVEALYAATSERRALLAGAISGLVQHDDSAELQSRIARAVVDLEPSDLAFLRILVERWDGKTATVDDLQRESDFSQLGSLQRSALVGAKCIVEVAAPVGIDIRHAQLTGQPVRLSAPTLKVTDLGHAVLRYVLTTSADSTTSK